MATTKLRLAAFMDQGMERDYQEDNYIVSPDLSVAEWVLGTDEITGSEWGSLLVVADGMGGLNAGEIASKLAIEGIKTFFDEMDKSVLPTDAEVRSILKQAILDTNERIVAHAHEHEEASGMGTTLVVAWLRGAQLHVCWSGDSRCYVLRGRYSLEQVNFDHSYVQELLNAGKISQEEAFYHPQKNIITQSLGDVGRPPIPDYKQTTLQAGDRILLCSDGVNTMLTDEQIGQYLAQGDLPDCARALVRGANNAGGYDNITVVLCELTEIDGVKAPPYVPRPLQKPEAAPAPRVAVRQPPAQSKAFKFWGFEPKQWLVLLLMMVLLVSLAIVFGGDIGFNKKGSEAQTGISGLEIKDPSAEETTEPVQDPEQKDSQTSTSRGRPSYVPKSSGASVQPALDPNLLVNERIELINLIENEWQYVKRSNTSASNTEEWLKIFQIKKYLNDHQKYSRDEICKEIISKRIACNSLLPVSIKNKLRTICGDNWCQEKGISSSSETTDERPSSPLTKVPSDTDSKVVDDSDDDPAIPFGVMLVYSKEDVAVDAKEKLIKDGYVNTKVFQTAKKRPPDFIVRINIEKRGNKVEQKKYLEQFKKKYERISIISKKSKLIDTYPIKEEK